MILGYLIPALCAGLLAAMAYGLIAGLFAANAVMLLLVLVRYAVVSGLADALAASIREDAL